ncbi:MAG TPA: serine/threonine-protein kinase [Candidatus Nanopelagicales bacterium]|nr:serine/threonine-protein kinase [Candidatus Nanopelagicales bacterium]
MFCPRCYRTYHEPNHRYCPADGAALLATSPLDRLRSRATSQRGAILGDRYAIQGFVGSGGMARVYLAEDLHTQQPVAVKILHKERAFEEEAVKRFLREVELSSTIVHPNMIRVVGSGERRDGVPYIVMEFLFGESLGDLLRRDGAVEPTFALPLLKKMAAGLAEAHRAGIIHRDVKPDNLFLVGERGDPYELKVVDFGMAKLMEREVTTAGMALGTLEYMAPEQAITDAVDARTDVYGLGVVMFRMMLGRVPFDARDSATLIAQHLFVAAPRPSKLRTDFVRPVEAVIMKALAKNPANRYASMQELLEDLERLLLERGSALAAYKPAHGPDEYEPRGTFAKSAALALRAHLDRATALGMR